MGSFIGAIRDINFPRAQSDSNQLREIEVHEEIIYLN
jgi:hypothetical protein